MSENGTSWASVIPDFFYELIGRIIPGGTFLLGLIYTVDQTFFCEVILKQKVDGSSVELPYFVIFIVFLGLSYSAGFFLTPLGDLLGKLFYIRRQYRKISNIDQLKDHTNRLLADSGFPNEKKNNSKPNPGSTSLNEENNINDQIIKSLSVVEFEWLYQCHHNLAKDGYPKQSRSLSKSAADVQLCINTSAAFFIITIVSLFHSCLLKQETLKECIHVIVTFIIGVFFLLAAIYRNRRYLLRLFSFSLGSPQSKN